MADKFSHLDQNNRPQMVDVSNKNVTKRQAHAQATVYLPPKVVAAIEGEDITTKKGPVFQTAIIAGTMAVKKTGELIPFCHPIRMESCKITIGFASSQEVVIDCRVKAGDKTGVEMEALTGASIAALTIYDMCKALSHEIVIRSTYLVSKTGGKSDYQRS